MISRSRMWEPLCSMSTSGPQRIRAWHIVAGCSLASAESCVPSQNYILISHYRFFISTTYHYWFLHLSFIDLIIILQPLIFHQVLKLFFIGVVHFAVSKDYTLWVFKLAVEWLAFLLRIREIRVQISVWRPSIIIEIPCGFCQSLKVSAGTVPQIRQRPLPFTSFWIHYSLIIRRYIIWTIDIIVK
jgi:hypothetical protein